MNIYATSYLNLHIPKLHVINMSMTSKICNKLTIKRKIKSQLALHGLRQQDLANALKIAPATLSNKLTGKIRFSANELSIMADLFGVSTDALLGREPMEVAK